MFLISVVFVATAQETPRIFFVLIQIIQRDDDGNLIAYIETDKISEINYNVLNFMLDEIVDETNTQTFNIQGKTIQVITQITPLTTDSSGLLATVKFQMVDTNGNIHDVVRFSHDGMRLNPDENVRVIWTFMRTI